MLLELHCASLALAIQLYPRGVLHQETVVPSQRRDAAVGVDKSDLRHSDSGSLARCYLLALL